MKRGGNFFSHFPGGNKKGGNWLSIPFLVGAGGGGGGMKKYAVRYAAVTTFSFTRAVEIFSLLWYVFMSSQVGFDCDFFCSCFYRWEG